MKKWIKRLFITFIIILLLAIGSGGAWWYYYGSKINVQLQNIQITLENQKGFILVDIELERVIPFDMKGIVSYEANWQQEKLASGSIKITIGQKTIVQIPVSVELVTMQKIRQSKGTLTITGTIKSDMPHPPIPFSLSKELTPKPKTNFEVMSFDVSAMSKNEVVLVLKLLIFPVPPIENINASYAVNFADKQVIAGNAYLQTNYQDDKAIVEIPVTLETQKIQHIKAKNIGKEIDIVINGELTGKYKDQDISVPFTVKKTVEIKDKAIKIIDKKIFLQKMSMEDVDAVVELQVENSSKREFHNIDAEYEIYADNTKILYGKAENIYISGNTENKIEIPIHFERKIWKNIKKQYNGKEIDIVIHGNLATKSKEQNLHIPFDVTKRITVREKSFNFKLKKIRIRKFRLFKESEYVLTLEITSLLPSPVENLHVEGDVEIVEGLNIQLNETLNLIPNTPTEITVTTSMKKGSIPKLLAKIIKNKTSESRLKLRIKGKDENGTILDEESTEEQIIEVQEEEQEE